MSIETLKSAFQTHWFWPLAIAIVSADSILARTVHWQPARPQESGVILDMAVLIPILYGLCYRHRGRAALFRAAALACLGVWVAGHVIPQARHDLIDDFSPLRAVGTAVLFLVEARLAFGIYRATVFSTPEHARDALAAAEQAGVPGWVTRVMTWEAMLWRRAGQWFKQSARRD